VAAKEQALLEVQWEACTAAITEGKRIKMGASAQKKKRGKNNGVRKEKPKGLRTLLALPSSVDFLPEVCSALAAIKKRQEDEVTVDLGPILSRPFGRVMPGIVRRDPV
jgi:hypothetical protein